MKKCRPGKKIVWYVPPYKMTNETGTESWPSLWEGAVEAGLAYSRLCVTWSLWRGHGMRTGPEKLFPAPSFEYTPQRPLFSISLTGRSTQANQTIPQWPSDNGFLGWELLTCQMYKALRSRQHLTWEAPAVRVRNHLHECKLLRAIPTLGTCTCKAKQRAALWFVSF